ncbi:endoribonuclease LACTB2 [Brevipalpus obovatus]|uniref:endoribonuclease LACTB2 n=1 Tax=Brevipalpus obovatus TaxID=246614 RepID=UPI003D9EE910
MLMAKLSKLPQVASLSDRVIRVLGCNPGPFTLQGTNTYLVGKGTKRVLIDTGEDDHPEYISLLKDVLGKNKISLSSIILTHWHPDHIGGLKQVLDLVDDKDCKVYKYPSEKYDNRLSDVELHYLTDEQEIRPSEDDDTVLRVCYTPGHSDDHIALHLLQEDVLFSGDCILGEGSVVFEDLSAYLESLEKIKKIGPSRIYPGHGLEVLSPLEKVNEYISHRLSREKDIIQTLNEAGQNGLSVEEIVASNYKLSQRALLRAAEWTVSCHLKKLVKDDVAVPLSSTEGSDVRYRLNKANP